MYDRYQGLVLTWTARFWTLSQRTVKRGMKYCPVMA